MLLQNHKVVTFVTNCSYENKVKENISKHSLTLIGENIRPCTGPSWPLSTSNNRPVFIDQTNIYMEMFWLSRELDVKHKT
jgi:hypothetical protein